MKNELMIKLKRFNQITKDDISNDFHIHSTWSDGKADAYQIAEAADAKGLQCIIFTDHIRKESTYFDAYHKQIRNIAHQFTNRIGIGVESKISDFHGSIDIPEKISRKCDLVIASVHRFPIGRKLFAPEEFSMKMCQEIEFELAMAALVRGGMNVLGHPGGMSLRTYKEFPMHYFEELINACNKKNIGFELDYSYHQAIIKGLFPLLRQYNPLISFGSDAHRVDEIGKWKEVEGIFFG